MTALPWNDLVHDPRGDNTQSQSQMSDHTTTMEHGRYSDKSPFTCLLRSFLAAHFRLPINAQGSSIACLDPVEVACLTPVGRGYERPHKRHALLRYANATPSSCFHKVVSLVRAYHVEW